MRRLIVGLVVALTAGLVTVPFTTAASATAGAPDPTFNGGEPLVFQHLDAYTDVADAVLLPNGNTFVVGRTNRDDPVVAIVAPTGVLSSVYLVELDGLDLRRFNQLAIDREGRVLAVGSTDTHGAVIRFLANGTVDPTFGTDGIALVEGARAHLFGDLVTVGNDVLAAFDSTAGTQLLRLSENGAVIARSTVFEPSYAPRSMARDSMGRVYLAMMKMTSPQDSAVIRLTAAGAPDPTFSDDGALRFPSPYAARVIALQDDRLLVGGGSPGWTVTRYDDGGSVDSTFGSAGSTTRGGSRLVTGMAVDSSDRIVLAASGSYALEVARLLPGGATDVAFGEAGTSTIAFAAETETWAPAVLPTATTVTVAGGVWLNAELNGFVARLASEAPPATTTTTTTATTSTTSTTSTTQPASSGGGGGVGGGGAPAAGPAPPTPTATPTTTTTAPPPNAPTAAEGGYWLGEHGGTIHAFGGAGALPAATIRIADIAATPDGTGVWAVDAAGHVQARGTAPDLDDAPTMRLFEVVVSISPTPTGRGYWLFTNHGRAFDYGDAGWFGDMSAARLNAPIVDSSATPDGKGYFLIGADGGVFTYGSATFHGSTGNLRLNQPVRALVPTTTGGGYWLVASDGGVFNFGDARFRGSMGATRLNAPVVGMVTYGDGYLMVASDGGVFTFSNRPFSGSLGSAPPSTPIVAITALP
jgi:uncharacterized delta-60 repeat protein